MVGTGYCSGQFWHCPLQRRRFGCWTWPRPYSWRPLNIPAAAALAALVC